MLLVGTEDNEGRRSVEPQGRCWDGAMRGEADEGSSLRSLWSRRPG